MARRVWCAKKAELVELVPELAGAVPAPESARENGYDRSDKDRRENDGNGSLETEAATEAAPVFDAAPTTPAPQIEQAPSFDDEPPAEWEFAIAADAAEASPSAADQPDQSNAGQTSRASRRTASGGSRREPERRWLE